MQTLLRDLRYGARMSLKKPGFTLIAVITLALGVGANAAIFTVVNGVLLRPLPYDEPDRLVMLWESDPRRNIERQLVAPPNLVEWREQSRSLKTSPTGRAVASSTWSWRTESKRRSALTSRPVFSRPCASGRISAARSCRKKIDPEGNLAAVLSYEYWRRRFAADPNVIGRTLTVDTFGRRDYTIVGVMQPGFRFPNQTEIWLPVGWDGIPDRGAATGYR